MRILALVLCAVLLVGICGLAEIDAPATDNPSPGLDDECTHEGYGTTQTSTTEYEYEHSTENSASHTRTAVTTTTTLCANCLAPIGEPAVVRSDPVEEKHRWQIADDVSTCALCGFVCEHAQSTTETYEEWNRNKPVDFDEKSHTIYYDVYTWNACSVCGWTQETPTYKLEARTEPHNMSGSECIEYGCEYVSCKDHHFVPDPDGQMMGGTTSYSPADADTHYVLVTGYVSVICEACGQEETKYMTRQSGDPVEHAFDENGLASARTAATAILPAAANMRTSRPRPGSIHPPRASSSTTNATTSPPRARSSACSAARTAEASWA